uniref:Uncharacterized protein n=1 Tax=Anguilla anguilla TaxID=7936 RepID=A0A0E9REY9_ANGAN
MTLTFCLLRLELRLHIYTRITGAESHELACKAVTVSALKSIQYGRHNSTNYVFSTHDSCFACEGLASSLGGPKAVGT